jgi:AraC-like DNA-binding protein
MQLLTYGPPASTAPYVEHMWTLRCPADGVFTLDLFANGVSGIIVQSHNGTSALQRPGVSEGWCAQPARGNVIPNAFIYGTRTRPGKLLARAPFELTGVVFRPHGLSALLGIDPAEVTNGPLDIDELFAGALGCQLLTAATASDRLAILARHLCARVADAKADDVLVNESLRLLRGQPRIVRLPWLLKWLGLSERQFERRFRKVIGFSPHRYLRILRFQEAVRLMRAQRFDRMSELACELDYTDQSHFTKEMKEFSGYTPGRLFRTIHASFDLPCALLAAHGSRRAGASAADGFLQATPGSIRENAIPVQ